MTSGDAPPPGSTSGSMTGSAGVSTVSDPRGASETVTAPTTSEIVDSDTLLAGYLRDHLAGAAAGLALARRCQRANAGTPLGHVMADVVDEITEDREALVRIMDRLGVSENVVKSLVARGAELLGRLKTNGTLTHYSPSSRVVELEGLLAGIDGKRNLWSSLRVVAAGRPELDRAALDVLHDRADSQHRRLTIEHDRAAAMAFTATAA